MRGAAAARAMLAAGAAAVTVMGAHAFELTRGANGEVTRWEPPTLRYSVVSAAELPRLGAAARVAFDAWTAVPGAAFVGEWAGSDIAGAPVQVRRDTGNEVRDALAITVSVYVVGTATIARAEIILSAEAALGDEASAYDLDSVLVHEAGHVLGLAHTCGDRSGRYRSCFDLDALTPRARAAVLGAVMAPTIAPSELRRVPTPDDVDGLIALYPGTRGPAPVIGAIARDCASGDVVVEVTPAGRVELRVRAEDGRTTDATVRSRAQDRVVIAAPEGSWDLRVDDPVEGSRATRVDVALADCAAPDGGVVGADVAAAGVDDGGCSCAGPDHSRDAPVLVVLLLFMANASALRRRP